jgi:tRNA (guanine10-N2)-methyltransferase
LNVTKMLVKKYLLHFAVAHDDFRLPELSSVSHLFNFEIGLPDDAKDYDPRRPFTIVTLECDKHARLLARRCTMIKLVVYH